MRTAWPFFWSLWTCIGLVLNHCPCRRTSSPDDCRCLKTNGKSTVLGVECRSRPNEPRAGSRSGSRRAFIDLPDHEATTDESVNVRDKDAADDELPTTVGVQNEGKITSIRHQDERRHQQQQPRQGTIDGGIPEELMIEDGLNLTSSITCRRLMIRLTDRSPVISNATFEGLLINEPVTAAGGLEAIDLSGQDVSSVDREAFDGLIARYGAVGRMDLSANNIREIDWKAFEPFKRLKLLNVSHNRMESIEQPGEPREQQQQHQPGQQQQQGQQLSIHSLDISNNLLVELPDNWTSMASILDLSSNRLTTLSPQHFIRLTQLQRLNVSWNNLSSLESGSFNGCTLKRFTKLDLSHNRISKLVNYTFFNLFALDTINLSFNEIDDIDLDAFFTWSNACDSASSNEYLFSDELYSSVSNSGPSKQDGCPAYRWAALHTVDLSHNSLKSIKDSLFRRSLCGIRVLLLGFNQLVHLPRYVVEHLHQLDRIDLQHNDIFWLDVGAFTNANLKHVDLSYNKLRKIISMTFLYLPSIVNIDLSHNEISYVYKYAFYRICKEENRKLINISLGFNRLLTDAVSKMLSIFQHQETGDCRALINLESNQVTRFIGETLGLVRTQINMADAKRFRHWDRVVVDLVDNNIVCDCHLADEFNFIEYVDKLFSSTILQNVVSWKSLPCSEPEAHRGTSVDDYLRTSDCLHMTNYFCPQLCECHRDTGLSDDVMNCSSRGLANFPTVSLRKATKIDLSHNELTEITVGEQSLQLSAIRTLDLSNNRIHSISGEFLKAAQLLEEILLHGNDLETLPMELFQLPLLRNFTLKANPLSCSCKEGSPLLENIFRRRQIISDFSALLCSDGRKLSSLGDMYNKSCAVQGSNALTKSINLHGIHLLTMLIGVPSIIIVLALLMLCHCRKKINPAGNHPVDRRSWKKIEHLRETRFDVFVAFCASDEEWVTKRLLNIIWQQFPQLSVQFQPDLPCDAVASWMEDSKVTIILLSKDYFQTNWISSRSTILENLESSRYLMVFICLEYVDLELFDPELNTCLKSSGATVLRVDDFLFENRLILSLSGVAEGKLEIRGLIDDVEAEDPAPCLEKY